MMIKRSIARADAAGRKRVVVTGLGVISPIGHGQEQFWEGLVNGRSGAGPIRSFDTSEFKSNIACEVKEFDFARFCPADRVAGYAGVGRATQLALAAAGLAVADGGLDAALSGVDRERAGVVLGTTMGEVQILHEIARVTAASGLPESDIYRHYAIHNLPAKLGQHYGLCGPNLIVPTACASGNYALGLACDMIREDRVDLAFAGGVDPIDSIVFAGFSRLFSVAPEQCQPFDKNRKGILVGEGAAILLLESLDRALARGARIYAEIAGYGLSCDAHHMTNPDPSVNGTYRAARAAFVDAGMTGGKVDCILAHGTGTAANDVAETKLIKRLFGSDAYSIPISANKSMIGHTMGGAAAMNAVTACRILTDACIPPTINYRTPDPGCDLDYVPNEARRAAVNVIMSNAFAFGGNNSTMLFRKWEE